MHALTAVLLIAQHGIPFLVQHNIPQSGRDGITPLVRTSGYGSGGYGSGGFTLLSKPDAGLGISSGLVDLGRRLFNEKALSRDGTVSCATCHDAHIAFTDGRAVARGIDSRVGTRNTPTLVNRGYGTSQFWDGRSLTLENQALEPIPNPLEMDLGLPEALARLAAGGYGTMSSNEIARAIAAYVRTIRSGDSPYDRYLRGDLGALDADAQRGLFLFRDKANCHICHGGANFTDEAFHNTGVAWKEGAIADEGRYVRTRKQYHLGAFKTPTLREVGLTAPYMHDGSLATLEDVVEFYDRGGRENPYLDVNMRPLHLSAADKRALVAFLRSLSGVVRDGL
jgi:cytochrome c peroxidase